MALMEHVWLVPSVRSRKARSTIAASQFFHLLRKITHTGIDSAVALAQTGKLDLEKRTSTLARHPLDAFKLTLVEMRKDH